MGNVSVNPYTGQAIVGYNNSPPPDDGSVTSSNKVEWGKHKTKLGDPIKTLSEAINTAATNFGAKTINTDAGVSNQISGSVGFQWATATIGTDAITPDATAVLVGSEAGATSDTLQTIDTGSVLDGAWLVLRQRNASEEINIIHATSTAATATAPNIFLNDDADFLLDDPGKSLTLARDDNTATGFVEISRTGSAPTKAGLKSVQTFTASGTWTKPAGITHVLVFNTAGGGGGGGSNSAGDGASGGGGGGTAIEFIDVSGTASETTTVGAGGTAGASGGGAGGTGGSSSFGALCSSTGGAGGQGNAGSGAAGGVGSGGDLNLTGQGGGSGLIGSSGIGGSSYFGAGGQGIAVLSAGAAGGNHGGGGSGGFTTGAGRAGGAGGAGVIYVLEFTL